MGSLIRLRNVKRNNPPQHPKRGCVALRYLNIYATLRNMLRSNKNGGRVNNYDLIYE